MSVSNQKTFVRRHVGLLFVVCFLTVGVLSQETDLGDKPRNKTIRKQFIQDAAGISRGYSQAVVVDDLKSNIRHVYLAGQASAGGGNLTAAILAVWDRIDMILDAANGDLKKIVTMTSSVRDLDQAKTNLFNAIRVQILGGDDPTEAPYPASMLLGTALANPALLVEIQAEAEYPIPRDWRVKPIDSMLLDALEMIN